MVFPAVKSSFGGSTYGFQMVLISMMGVKISADFD